MLGLFSGPLSLAHPHALAVLWAFFAWRAIGVARFFRTNDNAILKLHFDALNSTLIACVLAAAWPAPFRAHFWAFCALGAAAKVAFEFQHHAVPYRE